MKKRILFFSLLLITAAAYAQTELPSDSVRRSPAGNYKEFGGFLLDMGLMAVQAPKVQIPCPSLNIQSESKANTNVYTCDNVHACN